MSTPSQTSSQPSLPVDLSVHLDRVAARITDAELLYNAGRSEGSLLSLLVAIAGTSRRRYPAGTMSYRDPNKVMGDRECFTRFVSDEMSTLTQNPVFGSARNFGIHVAGQAARFENVLYDFLRNPQVHEGGHSRKIVFVPGSQFFLGFGDPTHLKMSHWIHRALFRVLMTVAENHGLDGHVTFHESHLVRIDNWDYLVLENWMTGMFVTDFDLKVKRRAPTQQLSDFAGDPNIRIEYLPSSSPAGGGKTP